MKKILIVEDQLEIRELIRVTLEFEDFEIAEAANADAALEKLATYRPDLLLLDVMMPGSMDGVELCRRVKSDPNTRRAKVIMLTAKSQAADRSAGMAAGADEYLVKPFSPLELMKTILRVLR